jgi:uncharacterized protein
MELNDFLERFPMPGKIMFAKVWGSKSHNTHKSDSDTDFSGVYVAPTREILSLNPPPDTKKFEKEDVLSKEDWPDHQFHEVGKFASLLLKGNPTILEMLFTNRLYVDTPDWRYLWPIRFKFLSHEAIEQYLGYMKGQLRRLMAHDGKKGLHTAGGAYNEKWAYHILRLSADAKRIARGEGPQVWKTGAERDFLMKVRNMEFDWQTTKSLIEESLADIENLKPWQCAETADKDALNTWLLEVRKNNW